MLSIVSVVLCLGATFTSDFFKHRAFWLNVSMSWQENGSPHCRQNRANIWGGTAVLLI